MCPVGPNLWRWTAPHPDWSPWQPKDNSGFAWSQEVGCVCYETPESLTLIDPLAPPANAPSNRQFWRALDNIVQCKRLPVSVLLSTDWHDRSAQAVLDRYSQRFGASLWIPGDVPQSALTCRPTDAFCDGDTLPGGFQAYSIQSPHPEVIFYQAAARALVVADSLWGTPDGRIWLGSHEVCKLLTSLLAEFSIEILLLSHGVPILSGAHTVLAQIVDERPEFPGACGS